MARKRGKRSILNEYVCICTGTQRGGDAYTATANKAKPSVGELIGIFENHIAGGIAPLFVASYRNAENIIRQLTDTVLAITDVDYYHSIKDIKGSWIGSVISVPTYFWTND